MFGRKGDKDEPAVTDVTAVTDVKDVTDVTEYLWILSSASSINCFSLLLSVNEPLHRGVLNKLFAGTLDKLAQTQTEVFQILIDRAQNLNKMSLKQAKYLPIASTASHTHLPLPRASYGHVPARFTREVDDVEEWTATREHLEKLQLAERVEESGANLMGDVVRKDLWEAYRVDLRVRSPVFHGSEAWFHPP